MQQNAFNPTDTYVPLEKQFEMLKTIDLLFELGNEAVEKQIPISQIKNDALYGKVINMKYDVPNDDLSKIVEINNEIKEFYRKLIDENVGE